MGLLELPLPRFSKRRGLYPWLFLLPLVPVGVAGFWVFGLPPWLEEVWTLVAFTLLAQVLAFWATERMARYPGRELLGVVAFNLLVATLILLAFLALGRFDYSRSFLLLAMGLALPTLFLYLYLRRQPPLRLALVPGGFSDRLAPKGFVPLPSLEGAEAVVADLHHLDPKALPLLAEASLKGLPILHAAQVYEAQTGRVFLEGGADWHRALEALVERDLGPYPYLKRAWEVGLVLLFSPLILCLFALVAFLVYLDLGRPVLFAQERVGLRGRSFRAYKFRSMRGAPREGAYAGVEQDRITPLGRVLRRFRLDELPQFWNVLKGEMSLVGPRPEQRVLAEAYAQEIPLYPLRHRIPPGLTGWAQVQQGYAEGKEGTLEKLSYDLYYIKHLSFWLDLRILLKTVWVILTGFGAR